MEPNYFFVVGYDPLGLPVYRQIWNGDPVSVGCRAELLLIGDADLARIEVDRLRSGVGRGMYLDRVYETRLPF
jgi:hypothetical protein